MEWLPIWVTLGIAGGFIASSKGRISHFLSSGAALLCLLVCEPVRSQSADPPSVVSCERAATGSVMVWAKIGRANLSLIEDQNWVSQYLERSKQILTQRCGGDQVPMGVYVSVEGDLGAGKFEAYRKGGPWTIRENSIASRLAQGRAEAQQQQQALEQARQAASARQRVRENFRVRFAVQKSAHADEITANPFIFKDSVVAIQSRFVRMLSESEAQFTEIFVTGVPATQFRGNENVVIAVRVRGTRTVKLSGGEVITPDLQYVGVFICAQNGCGDFQQ